MAAELDKQNIIAEYDVSSEIQPHSDLSPGPEEKDLAMWRERFNSVGQEIENLRTLKGLLEDRDFLQRGSEPFNIGTAVHLWKRAMSTENTETGKAAGQLLGEIYAIYRSDDVLSAHLLKDIKSGAFS